MIKDMLLEAKTAIDAAKGKAKEIYEDETGPFEGVREVAGKVKKLVTPYKAPTEAPKIPSSVKVKGPFKGGNNG